MAQVAQMPSGLEVYTRRSDLPSRDVTDLQDQYPTACGQDEYPTALRQDEYPTACNVSPPYHAAIKEAEPTGENGGSLEKSAGELKAKENRIWGVSRLTFWLGLVVGVLIVVVAVVGGTLGSRIRKESGSVSSPSSISLSPTSASFFSLSTSSSATPTSTLLATLPEPVNDCTAYGTPFSMDVSGNQSERNPWANASFDIYCKTDYRKGDFTSFYASSLLICMNACASFNYWQDYNGDLAKMNCSGVVYSLDLRAYGNCYLKSGGYVTKMTRNEVCAYAMLKNTSTS